MKGTIKMVMLRKNFNEFIFCTMYWERRAKNLETALTNRALDFVVTFGFEHGSQLTKLVA